MHREGRREVARGSQHWQCVLLATQLNDVTLVFVYTTPYSL